jgi:hypothetical protein
MKRIASVLSCIALLVSMAGIVGCSAEDLVGEPLGNGSNQVSSNGTNQLDGNGTNQLRSNRTNQLIGNGTNQ